MQMKKGLILFTLMALCLLGFSQRPIFYTYKEASTSGGNAYAEYWWSNSNNSSISKTLDFPSTGSYRVDVSGYKVKGTPNFGIYIDGVKQDSLLRINTSDIGMFSVLIPSVTAGSHTLKIQLDNFGI